MVGVTVCDVKAIFVMGVIKELFLGVGVGGKERLHCCYQQRCL